MARWRASWNDAPVARLTEDVTLLERRLSSKKVHEIQADVARMPAPEDLVKSEDRPWAELLAADVRRTLLRSTEGEGVLPAEAGLDLEGRVAYGPLRRRIERWVARMLVVRTLGEARSSREPRRREA